MFYGTAHMKSFKLESRWRMLKYDSTLRLLKSSWRKHTEAECVFKLLKEKKEKTSWSLAKTL